MSNATLAVYGRLGSDPREHATRKGGAMAGEPRGGRAGPHARG